MKRLSAGAAAIGSNGGASASMVADTRKDGLLKSPAPLHRQRSGSPTLDIPRLPSSKSSDDLHVSKNVGTSLGAMGKADRRVISATELGRGGSPTTSPLASPRGVRLRVDTAPPFGAGSAPPSVHSSASSLHSTGEETVKRERRVSDDCIDVGKLSAGIGSRERRRSLPASRRRELDVGTGGGTHVRRSSVEVAVPVEKLAARDNTGGGSHVRRSSAELAVPLDKLLNPREDWVRPWRKQGVLHRVSGVDVFELLSHELFSEGDSHVSEAAQKFREWIRLEFENRNRDFEKEISELKHQLDALHRPAGNTGLTAAFDRVNSLLVRQSNLEAELLRTRCQCEEFAAKLGKFAASIAAWSERAPQGRVTLVYTDIQGSTGLWESCPEDMSRALSTHDAILRRLLAEIGGYEVKTVGDAFMVCFQEALPAVKWCMRAQIELLSADWPGVLHGQSDSQLLVLPTGEPLFRGLRVRMGVHCGVPSMVHQNPISGRTDYFGPFVNRAARVESLAKGGQVLLSDAVLAEIEPDLKAIGSPVVVDLGEHALKGLDTRQRIYQILPKEIAGRTFPPLQAIVDVDKDSTMSKELPGPSGRVTLVYCRVEGAEDLWSANFAVTKHAMCVHDNTLRACTEKLGGYEVRSEACTWMAAFSSSRDAAQFCAEVHRSMLDAEWPEALLDLPQACVVFGETCAVDVKADSLPRATHRGLRLKVAMHTGHPTCVEEAASRRTQYIGPDASLVMHVAGMARGGQTLLSEHAFNSYRNEIGRIGANGADGEAGDSTLCPVDDSGISTVAIGDHYLRGIDGTVSLYELTSNRLPHRQFAPPDAQTSAADETGGPQWAMAQLHELQAANDRLVGRLQRIARQSEDASGEAMVLRKALDDMRKAQDTDPASLNLAYEQIELFRREHDGLRKAVADALLRNRTLTTKMDDFDSQIFTMNAKVEHERARRMAAQAVYARARAAIASMAQCDADACSTDDNEWRTLPLPSLSRESSVASESTATPSVYSGSRGPLVVSRSDSAPSEQDLALATLAMETDAIADLVTHRKQYVAALRERLRNAEEDRAALSRAVGSLEARVSEGDGLHAELVDTISALSAEVGMLRADADTLRAQLSAAVAASPATHSHRVPAGAAVGAGASAALDAAEKESERRRAMMARVESLVRHFEGKARGSV
eukprot:Opistho-2@41313